MGIIQQDLVRGVGFVLVGFMVHRSVLKIPGTGFIKLATKVMVREVREVMVKTDGKAKEGQAGGIEDPGAVAPPAQRVGRVTRAPREKRVKWSSIKREKARDTPRRQHERTVRVRTSCITAL